MADVFGRTQAKITTTIAAVYTVPIRASLSVGGVDVVRASAEDVNTQSQITSIIIAEVAGGTATYSLWVTDDAGTASVPVGVNPIVGDATQIASLVPMFAQEVHILAHGLVLGPDNTIWALADANAKLVITVNHIEVS